MKRKYITYDEYLSRYDKKKTSTIFVDADKLSRQGAHEIIHTRKSDDESKDNLEITEEAIENEAREDGSSEEQIRKELDKEIKAVEYIEREKISKKRKPKAGDTDVPKNKGIGLFGMSVLMIFFAIAMFSGNMLVNNLTLKHYLGTTKRINVEKTSFYAIQMGAYTTKADAYERAVETRLKGGAGYVLNEGGLYRVIANVYTSEEDASVVIAKMTEQNENGVAFAIESPALMIDFDADSANIQVIEKSIACISDSLVYLNSFANALNSGEKTLSATQLELISRRSDVEQCLAELTEVIETVSDLRLVRIKAELSVLINNLSSLRHENKTESEFAGEIRYVYCSTVFSYKSLLIEIA